jgi:pectin methylesterase-like acyl-CoA thioesterase
VIIPLDVHNHNTSEDFTTIQAAIDAFNTTNGHTIMVDPGTYKENVKV